MPFCKYCGSPLEEGQACSCAQSQAAGAGASQGPSAAAAVSAAAATAAKNGMNSLVPFLKAYVSSPAQAVRTAATQNDMTVSVVLAVIQALVGGLALFSVLSRICSWVKDAAVTLGMIYDSGSGLGGLANAFSVKPSFLMSMVFGILAVAVALILFTLVVLAVSRLTGGTTSFKTCFILSAANTPFITVLLALAALTALFSIPLTLAVLAITLLACAAVGVVSAQLATPNSHSGKFWVCYLVGIALVLAVCYFIFPKLIMGAVGAVTVSYMGSSVKVSEGLKNLSNFSIEDILNDLIRNIF